MKKYLLTGLMILLPLVITIWFVVFLVNLFTDPLMGLVEYYAQKYPPLESFYLSHTTLFRGLAHIAILIVLFFLVVLLGFLGRWFLMHYIIRGTENLMGRIPFINKVYKVAKEVIKTFFSSKTESFRQVVLVPFPHEGTWVMGLVSQDAPQQCRDAIGEDLVSIFIATCPNPTTGFLVMYPRSKLIHLDMKVEEAIKFIVSVGLISPESNEQINPVRAT
jgi:uncharacterized membrane protein